MDLPKQSWVQNLTPRELVLLILTVLVILGAGYYKLEYEALAKEREAVVSRTERVTENLKSFRTALSRIKPEELAEQVRRVSAEIETIQEEVDRTKSRMTEKVEDIVRALSKQARHHRAEMRSFNSREKRVQADGVEYKEVTLFLTIKSRYKGVGRFVQALEKIPAVLAIRDMEIRRTRQTHPLVETDLTLKLYVL